MQNTSSVSNASKSPPIPIHAAHIVFDLHGVLISKIETGKKYDALVCELLVEQFDLPHDQTVEAIKEANIEWLSFWTTAKNLAREDFIPAYEEANALWAKIISQGVFKGDARQLAEFLEYTVPSQVCCPFPEVLPALQELSALGVSLSVASSAYSRHTFGALVGCRLLRYFQNIVGLEHTRAFKAQLAYFKEAFSLIGATPANCIFIGNSDREIILPKQLGAKVVHISRETSLSSEKDALILSHADLVLPDLTDLKSQLVSNGLLSLTR